MPSNYLEYVIFSVDGVTNLNTYQKALRQLDTLRATKMMGGVTMCIGSYYGELEPSFMVTAHDWDNVVRAGMSLWMEKQESILRIPGDERQPCVLTTPSGEFIEALGTMEELDEHSLVSQNKVGGWTYVLSSGKYHAC